LSDLTLSKPAALGTLISKNIFNRLRWSNAEQHASSKATTLETLVVTTLLEQLELPPLSTRRKIACITLLHKAIHEKVAIPIPSYIIKPTRTLRFHHPKRYIQIRPKKDVYNYSFFPRTIRDWNQLSDELLDIESSEEFKSRLTKLYYGG
jgi:hypothetical protein